jgi:peptidoglycan/xylan/chitin deacetylase (PgdA/CDA1 family)
LILRRFAAFAAALTLVVPTGSAAARNGQVALTFDDLPGLTILSDQSYVDDLNIAILRGLRRYHFPATGFVNEGKLDTPDRDRQIADLKRWVDAGMDLGNHGYSHRSPDDLGTAGYIADIARGEPVTRGLLGQRGGRLRWFRYPYLATGSSEAAKRTIAMWLGQHGYRVAPVTIDAQDWEFAEPYDDAVVRNDVAGQRRIKTEYLAYTARRIAWARAGARALFGRDIAQVMLLHCTRLNADSIDGIARLLREAGLRPVSLSRAMRDPAYRRPDTYVGEDGIDWLDRWATTANKDLPDLGDDDPPADIQADYDRVDGDRKVAVRAP